MSEFGYIIPLEKIYPLMGYKKTEAIRMMLKEFEFDAPSIAEDNAAEYYINNIYDRFIQLMIEYYSTTPQLQPLPNAEEVFEVAGLTE
jgi:hypothetical protein